KQSPCDLASMKNVGLDIDTALCLAQACQLRFVEILAVRVDFNLVVGSDLRIDQRLRLFQKCLSLDRNARGSYERILGTMAEQRRQDPCSESQDRNHGHDAQRPRLFKLHSQQAFVFPAASSRLDFSSQARPSTPGL